MRTGKQKRTAAGVLKRTKLPASVSRPKKRANTAHRETKTTDSAPNRQLTTTVRLKKKRIIAGASARDRALKVLADMRRSPSLTLTQAARNREIDPRLVRQKLPTAFRKDSSGRIKAKPSDRYRQTLYIPSTKPDVRIPVATKNSRDRQLVGRWMDALNAAGRGDFSKLKKFPKGQFVGGVRLPTGTYEVQRILDGQAEQEAPYEGLYRGIARPL